MGAMGTLRLNVMLALALALLSSAGPARAATKYGFDESVCVLAGRDWYDTQRMRCGNLVVSEPGMFEPFRLPVLRIAAAGGVGKDVAPAVFLNGGPGGGGIIEVADWLAHPLLRDRDLILFDPRGAGRSTPALCPDLGRHVMAALMRDLDWTAEGDWRSREVAECLRELPFPVDAGLMSSAKMADDLDAVRAALGYERLQVYGVSYGTRVALAYAGAYPERVAGLVLDSAIPADRGYYADIPHTFDAALESVFDACESDTTCDARFPSLRTRYAAMMRKLDSDPLVVHMPANTTRPAGKFTVNARDVRLLLHQLMYGKAFIPILPAAIDALAKGDAAALPLLFEVSVGMRVDGLNFASYYLTLAEDEPPMPSDPDVHGGEGDLAFFDTDPAVIASVRGQRSTRAPLASYAGIHAPTLLLVGRLDPIAAPEYGRAIAGALRRTQVVEFTGLGHAVSFSEPCTQALIAAFMRSPGTAVRNPGCPAKAPIPFASDIVPSGGLRDLAQRVMFARSMMPLAPASAAIGLYLLVAGLLLLSALLALSRILSRTSTPHTQRGANPLRRTSLAGGAISVLVVLAWLATLAVIFTGSTAAAVVFGVPAWAALTLTFAFMLLSATTLYMAIAGIRQWRGVQSRPRDRVRFVLLLLANGLLIGFLLVNGLGVLV